VQRIQTGEGAKFNSSLADLERIHLLLVMANEHSIQGELNGWIGALHAIDREISPYLNKEEEGELNPLRVNNITSDPRANSLIKNKLDTYERKLRFFRSKKKLGIVAEDDASTAALR